MMLACDDFSRFSRVFFLKQKSETASYFAQYLAEVSPRKVQVVRSDGGGEFNGGAFSALCRDKTIKQEFTTADSPEFNGVAERAIAMIESAGLAAKLQAPLLFSGEKLPEGNSLWAEQANWACDALNRTATTANPGCRLVVRFTPHAQPNPFP